MSNSPKISLEVIGEHPKHVSYSHKMDPAFRNHQTPWGRYQTGGGAGSFGAYSLDVVEPRRKAENNLVLRHRGPHSSGSNNFGSSFSHLLDVRIYEVEPEMLEITTFPNDAELQEGVFPSGYGLVPDCRWQITAPLHGGGLVIVSLCPERAFTETRVS